jgi:diguanylate cyclase (GGDEF)-like protein
VRDWPLWELPRWLVAFIAAVTVADMAAIGLAVSATHVSWHDLWLFGALMACVAATVELTKRAGENAGWIKDVYAVWELPVAILLPVVYALLIPIFRLALTQWRIRRVAVHRRVFSAAAVGLSYGAASLAFHGLTSKELGAVTLTRVDAATWMLALAAAAFVQWAVNTTLLMPAVKGSDPSVRIRDLYLAKEGVHNDVAELCVAVLVTLGIAVTPVTIVFAFPFVTLLQRSFRHAQLVNATRVDSKTGLLNAGTWEREAAHEVARAVRTHSPLAVALIDVDHFKAVNDLHGHLVGDKALRAISQTLTVFLREYDLVGRFGGEEFALILPQTRAVDAYRIAERIRAYIAAMPIDTGGDRGDEPVTVTVSIGVAALGSRWDTGSSQLTDLIAAADAALYRAKRDGRDQVCVVTEKATLTGQPEVPARPPGEVPPPAKANRSSPEPAGSQA